MTRNLVINGNLPEEESSLLQLFGRGCWRVDAVCGVHLLIQQSQRRVKIRILFIYLKPTRIPSVQYLPGAIFRLHFATRAKMCYLL